MSCVGSVGAKLFVCPRSPGGCFTWMLDVEKIFSFIKSVLGIRWFGTH